MERQRRAYEELAARHRRGHDEGGVIVLDDDSDDGAPPTPVRQGDAGQGSSRGGVRVKEENAGDDDGDFAKLTAFFAP